MAAHSGTVMVVGADALHAQFAALTGHVRQRVLSVSVSQAAEVIRDEVSRRAPVGETGNLAGSVVVKAGRRSSTFAGAVVGHTRKGSHAHLVEFGTQPHDIPRANGGVMKHPGAKPRPYMFPAFESKRSAAAAIIETAVREAIETACAGGSRGQ